MFEPKHLKFWTMPDNYFGQCYPATYSAGIGQSRDSDAMERSNFRSMVRALEEVGQEVEDAWYVVRENHWAVGWVEWIAIHQDAGKALEVADRIIGKMDDYPVIDEDDFSELEQEDAEETWKNCYNPRERLEYIRENREQFNFASLGDLLGCVRGKYFAGYASELL